MSIQKFSADLIKLSTWGIEESGGRIDYVTALDVDTMEEPVSGSKALLVAAAVFYGTTRLIDNEVVELK